MLCYYRSILRLRLIVQAKLLAYSNSNICVEIIINRDLMVKLLQCSEQSIQLKGYSKSSSFKLTNLHPQLYVVFKIDSRPTNEFIIIPENGILAPNETKDYKVYLSKKSMHKQELFDCQIRIFGSLDYRYNESIAKQANLGPWHIIQQQNQGFGLPVTISLEYSQMKSDLVSSSMRSRSSNSRMVPLSNSPPTPEKVLNKSEESSISMHSEHQIDDDVIEQGKPMKMVEAISSGQVPVKLVQSVMQPMKNTQQMQPIGNSLNQRLFPYKNNTGSPLRYGIPPLPPTNSSPQTQQRSSQAQQLFQQMSRPPQLTQSAHIPSLFPRQQQFPSPQQPTLYPPQQQSSYQSFQSSFQSNPSQQVFQQQLFAPRSQPPSRPLSPKQQYPSQPPLFQPPISRPSPEPFAQQHFPQSIPVHPPQQQPAYQSFHKQSFFDQPTLHNNSVSQSHTIMSNQMVHISNPNADFILSSAMNAIAFDIQQKRQLVKDLGEKRMRLQSKANTISTGQAFMNQNGEFLIMVFFIGLMISLGSHFRTLFE